MKKVKLPIYIMIISTLILTAGCAGQKEIGRNIIQKGDKEITVIQDTNSIVGEDIIEKIQTYEDVKEYGWLEGDKIIGLIENENKQSEIGGEIYDLRIILNTIGKKLPAEKLPQDFVKLSPDNKLIFFVDQVRDAGYILDLEGNIKAKAKGPYVSELGEARWFNNEGLIMPCKGTGLYSISIDGTETKIENVENEDSIRKAIKLDNKIYYTTSIGLDRKMKVYDISTKEKKLFIEDRVVDFYLSPKQNQFIVDTHSIEQDKTTLLLVDLEGKNIDVVTEGRIIYGTSWSPDGSKFAYILSSIGEEDEGLFIIDIEKKKKNQVSTTYLNIVDNIRWNPLGNKIMLANEEVKDGKSINMTHIITLK